MAEVEYVTEPQRTINYPIDDWLPDPIHVRLRRLIADLEPTVDESMDRKDNDPSYVPTKEELDLVDAYTDLVHAYNLLRERW